jgi:hypothetical protein
MTAVRVSRTCSPMQAARAAPCKRDECTSARSVKQSSQQTAPHAASSSARASSQRWRPSCAFPNFVKRRAQTISPVSHCLSPAHSRATTAMHSTQGILTTTCPEAQTVGLDGVMANQPMARCREIWPRGGVVGPKYLLFVCRTWGLHPSRGAAEPRSRAELSGARRNSDRDRQTREPCASHTGSKDAGRRSQAGCGWRSCAALTRSD